MTNEEIKNIIIDTIKDTINIPNIEICECTTLKDDLEFDSLDEIDLLISLEGRFNINISDSELDSSKTILDVITLISKYINENK